MSLRLYDTLSREKREFTPIDASNVRIYVCGPTVYDYAHIGNARPVIVFDVLFRLLRHIYGADHVTYVRNITDVDDKINDRALRDFPGVPLNAAIRKVAEATESQFQADVTALGCLAPTHQPRATDFVTPRTDGRADMVTLIRQLIQRGHAYEAGGEVLFDTLSMPDYGALSGRRLDEQKSGARIAVDAHKKSPGDFVLWKQSSAEEPGWDSPWGRGRPGWHIECSAMAAAYLGDVFDIHGGGLDLIFPHHENEIAQSRCAHDTPTMAHIWMHNGFLQVEGEKMSKSLGNFVTIRELLDEWPGDVVRLQMLMTHYRQPIDWTEDRAELARAELENWADCLGEYFERAHLGTAEPVVEALSDDLNTSNAITVLRAQFTKARNGSMQDKYDFAACCSVLGFYQLNLPGVFRFGSLAINAKLDALNFDEEVQRLRAAIGNREPQAKIDRLGSAIREAGLDFNISDSGEVAIVGLEKETQNIAALIEERTAARAGKDFAESDRIRDELAGMGVVLKDGKDADGKPVTTWEIAR